jgi:hypothetical protein
MNDCFIEFSGEEYSSINSSSGGNVVERVALKSKITITAKNSIKNTELDEMGITYWCAEEFANNKFLYRISKEEYKRLRKILLNEKTTDAKNNKVESEVKTNLDRMDVE